MSDLVCLRCGELATTDCECEWQGALAQLFEEVIGAYEDVQADLIGERCTCSDEEGWRLAEVSSVVGVWRKRFEGLLPR